MQKKGQCFASPFHVKHILIATRYFYSDETYYGQFSLPVEFLHTFPS